MSTTSGEPNTRCRSGPEQTNFYGRFRRTGCCEPMTSITGWRDLFAALCLGSCRRVFYSLGVAPNAVIRRTSQTRKRKPGDAKPVESSRVAGPARRGKRLSVLEEARLGAALAAERAAPKPRSWADLSRVYALPP